MDSLFKDNTKGRMLEKPHDGGDAGSESMRRRGGRVEQVRWVLLLWALCASFLVIFSQESLAQRHKTLPASPEARTGVPLQICKGEPENGEARSYLCRDGKPVNSNRYGFIEERHAADDRYTVASTPGSSRPNVYLDWETGQEQSSRYYSVEYPEHTPAGYGGVVIPKEPQGLVWQDWEVCKTRLPSFGGMTYCLPRSAMVTDRPHLIAYAITVLLCLSFIYSQVRKPKRLVCDKDLVWDVKKRQLMVGARPYLPSATLGFRSVKRRVFIKQKWLPHSFSGTDSNGRLITGTAGGEWVDVHRNSYELSVTERGLSIWGREDVGVSVAHQFSLVEAAFRDCTRIERKDAWNAEYARSKPNLEALLAKNNVRGAWSDMTNSIPAQWIAVSEGNTRGFLHSDEFSGEILRGEAQVKLADKYGDLQNKEVEILRNGVVAWRGQLDNAKALTLRDILE